MLGFQVQFVRISDIVFAVLFVFDYIVFNVTFAHGGAGWWLWALGMAQIGGDEKTGVRALSLLVRCPKACGIALLKPNEQRRPHADMVYIDFAHSTAQVQPDKGIYHTRERLPSHILGLSV